jgi:ubiquinone/menaquinone biosynthesis C-methylase UbiE
MVESNATEVEVPPGTHVDVESAVLERYAAGARQPEKALCCPTSYDPSYLRILPREIVEKDYGCGDPSKYVRAGETVLDLGSGSGKVCYILAQKVGREGRVIGADFNDAMLALARKYQTEMARKLGHGNVRFVKAKIQDLALDLEGAQAWLDRHPVCRVEDWNAYHAECARLRRERPAVPGDSVDVVVSNCVLNLVQAEEKKKLFGEIHRVLKRGGRAVISDIVSDESVPDRIRADSHLWSGCVSGALREDRFLEMFAAAGFHGIEILERAGEPWQVVEGIEFRSLTVRAYKGKDGPCLERNQAVIYRGPWKQVQDDDGHVYHRGQRMAVCDKTFRIMTSLGGPYAGQLIPVPPAIEIPLPDAQPFDCSKPIVRDPRETKGLEFHETRLAGDSCCGPGGCV